MPYQNSNSFQNFVEKAAVHFQNKLPGVLYRNPKEDTVQAIFQNDSSLQEVTDFTESGFVFGPYLDDTLPVLIKADSKLSAIFKTDEKHIISQNILFNESVSEENRYNKLVEDAVRSITLGVLKKVVLSRKLEVATKRRPMEIFQRLLNRYPNAFCYYWYHPSVGTWVGATPEILMRQRGKKFSTVALAGTLQESEHPIPVWGAKEKEEQQMVTTYIETVLADQVEKMQRSDVETVKAGNLWHLKTTIRGEALPGKTRSIMRSLHPTPAVCGMPLKAARSFILKHENYPRRYYTGYLGEINLGLERDTRLFVNLRCMELIDQKAVIYVGGGITEDSDPALEWEETVAKSKTMLQVV
ncbi:chorismate-binding protein [uncultured Muriicola sp.]|uniref:chorismate-binding protein n=1 Tax=uncultured Muriicola sp. TaxID=1583102 RepID=UPI002633ACF8|nr:chorismate-binding protein [uncultured Muriicola sp.]